MTRTLDVLHVVGARPNFMKVAPTMAALRARSGVTQCLVHTGQHYDVSMSDVFFRDLGMPAPDVFLGVGSGSHAEQTAKVLVAFEQVCLERRPERVVVVGDVNSTLACSLVAAKLQIPCAHVEAGLRSNDWSMPEEINRVVTDRICDLLLTPSADADENLRREGTREERIVRVGNVMIDSLHAHKRHADAIAGSTLSGLGVEPRRYFVVTLHRPSNVDDDGAVSDLAEILLEVARERPVVFPVHPRTRGRLERLGLARRLSDGGCRVIEPLGYLQFLALTASALGVLTDSGGLQEETTALGIPCLTMRENTERPITVTEGTNLVVGRDRRRILDAVGEIIAGRGKSGRVPELWDGRAAERVADALLSPARSGSAGGGVIGRAL